MKKYLVKFQREFEVEVEAVSSVAAQVIVRGILVQFPAGSTKLLSIVEEGHADHECVGCAQDGPIKPVDGPSGGNPHKGGTPGAGTPRVEVLVDQIAQAA